MFDLTEPSGIERGGSADAAEDRVQALDLDHVADARRGAVALDQPHRVRRDAGVPPGALDREALADRDWGP